MQISTKVVLGEEQSYTIKKIFSSINNDFNNTNSLNKGHLDISSNNTSNDALYLNFTYEGNINIENLLKSLSIEIFNNTSISEILNNWFNSCNKCNQRNVFEYKVYEYLNIKTFYEYKIEQNYIKNFIKVLEKYNINEGRLNNCTELLHNLINLVGNLQNTCLLKMLMSYDDSLNLVKQSENYYNHTIYLLEMNTLSQILYNYYIQFNNINDRINKNFYEIKENLYSLFANKISKNILEEINGNIVLPDEIKLFINYINNKNVEYCKDLKLRAIHNDMFTKYLISKEDNTRSFIITNK